MKINSCVYAEVFEILKYMDKTDVMKIPVELLTKIKECKDDNYVSKIDKNDLFNRENVMPETIKYIAWLDVNFWESQSEKNRLKKLYLEKKKKEEEFLKYKYNINEIFDSDKKETEAEESSIIKCNDNILNKIINFIKSCFKK